MAVSSQLKWNRAHVHALRAHRAVRRAIRDGKLQRPEACEQCGEVGRVDGHHPDYAKPLKVKWWCRRCHQKTHAKARKSR